MNRILNNSIPFSVHFVASVNTSHITRHIIHPTSRCLPDLATVVKSPYHIPTSPSPQYVYLVFKRLEQTTHSQQPLTQPKGLCHCRECRKMTSSAFSTNVVIPPGTFKVTGPAPKESSHTADSGNKITNYFCGDCGTQLWGIGGFGENLVIRTGVLDSQEDFAATTPAVEFFAERRLPWIGKVEGTTDIVSMGKSG